MRAPTRSRQLLPTFTLACAIATLVVAVTGCTPWATYPPIEGAVSVDNPTMHPIPDLMGEALWHVWEMDGGAGSLVFNLPPGTRGIVYDKVMHKLGGGAPMRDASQAAYHVTNVRIRTVDAEVDVIRRNDRGVPELLTLTFKQNFLKGYMVQDVRVWRYAVDEPPPYYVPETMRAGQPVSRERVTGDE